MGDPRSWGDDQLAFEQVLDEHGITPLPDPPLEFPEWLADLRAHWNDESSLHRPRAGP
jgi:hypothetical protein